MLNFFKKLGENPGLKITALILTLALWFYVVGELNKGSEEERLFLNSVLPQKSVAAKKLVIKPVFIGSPRHGYAVISDKVVVVPEYCIVVGTKDLLANIRFVYTLPVEIKDADRTFIRSVPLNPIAPGIYMEETLVQITVPIEKEA